MAKYKFWDKKEPIYTLGCDATGKSMWTADEYIRYRAAWAGKPEAKVIILDSAINGGVFLELNLTKDTYARAGMVIPDGTTDEQFLKLMEEWENRVTEPKPTAEERIAAAMEFQNLLAL